MNILERIIHWGRQVSGGLVSLLVIGISSVIFVISGSNILAKSISVVIVTIAFSTVFVSRFITGNVSLTCVQTEPEPRSSARSQHFKEYSVVDGFAELEVFVEVPEWASEFEIRMDVTDPFDLSVWKLPDPIKFTDQRLICRQNIHEFSFNLTTGGDVDKLGTGAYTLKFIDHNSNTEIDSIILKTRKSGKE